MHLSCGKFTAELLYFTKGWWLSDLFAEGDARVKDKALPIFSDSSISSSIHPHPPATLPQRPDRKTHQIPSSPIKSGWPTISGQPLTCHAFLTGLLFRNHSIASKTMRRP